MLIVRPRLDREPVMSTFAATPVLSRRARAETIEALACTHFACPLPGVAICDALGSDISVDLERSR